MRFSNTCTSSCRQIVWLNFNKLQAVDVFCLVSTPDSNFSILDVAGCLEILLIEEDHYQIWLIADCRLLWHLNGVDHQLLFVNHDALMVGYSGYPVDNTLSFIILHYAYRNFRCPQGWMVIELKSTH